MDDLLRKLHTDAEANLINLIGEAIADDVDTYDPSNIPNAIYVEFQGKRMLVVVTEAPAR